MPVHTIEWPVIIDGPINGLIFQTYVGQILATVLKPGHTVITDNVSDCKRPGARAAIDGRGAVLPLPPPYSPGLNPIERAVAVLEPLVQTAQERTREAIWRRIGAVFEHITPHECHSYISNAGHRQS